MVAITLSNPSRKNMMLNFSDVIGLCDVKLWFSKEITWIIWHMSYRQISCSIEAERLDDIMIASLWNLTGISAVLLPRFQTSRDCKVRRNRLVISGPGGLLLPNSAINTCISIPIELVNMSNITYVYTVFYYGGFLLLTRLTDQDMDNQLYPLFSVWRNYSSKLKQWFS